MLWRNALEDVIRMRFFLVVCLLALSTTAIVAQPSDDAYKQYLALTRSTAAALNAGQLDAATTSANDLLKIAQQYQTDWNYGNAVHVAHIVLGRVALRSADITEAEKQLLAAASASELPYGMKLTPVYGVEPVRPKGWKASPSLDSFGPDMTLARELLEKGRKDSVLDYLKLCSEFWSSDHGKIAEWTTDIKAGRIPNFGPNLRYFF